MRAILDTEAKTHSWCERLFGWQVRTFDTLAQRVTPLEGAALRALLEAELARLGPAVD